jgi:hypothetical protein
MTPHCQLDAGLADHHHNCQLDAGLADHHHNLAHLLAGVASEKETARQVLKALKVQKQRKTKE